MAFRSEYRRAQREHEQLAVRLPAIKPFLSDMTHAKRDDVMEKLAEQLLGLSRVAPTESEDLVLPPGVLTLLQMLLNGAGPKP